uniref:MSCRAMM family protein n=1 Tax=uncultured Clostridium sp. TaxID=59620 RepID=UPI0026131F01
KDGVANLKDLAWGTYTVKETKAPIGYSLNNEIQTVKIDAQDAAKMQLVNLKDAKILGQILITKTNENGTVKLQGAEFTVTGPNGYKEVVTTGANGIASLSNLEWGTYYVKEIKAPQGYNINNTIYSVNINAQDALKVQAVKVKDSRIEQVSTTHNTTTSNNNKTTGNTSNTNKTTGNTSNTTSNSSSQGLSPKTGDASELPIYGLLAIAIVGLVVNTRRKKKLAK